MRWRCVPPGVCAAAVALLPTACGHDWDPYDPRLESEASSASASVTASSAGGASSSGSMGSGGAGGAAQGGGGDAGAGGAPAPVCGDGVLGADEECDDGNGDPSDGCDGCDVVCAPTEHEDPASHHCYWIGTELPWTDAKLECEASGGHLATITSQPELDFVRTFAMPPNWLGASEIALEDDWLWVTGEAWLFTAWNAGEPNDYGGFDEDCLTLHIPNAMVSEPAGFNDEICGDPHQGICEREPAGAEGGARATP